MTHSSRPLPPPPPLPLPLPPDALFLPSQPIPGFPPLPILLTNTLVPKNTRALVAGVRRLLEAHRGPTAATFDAIGAIAAEFVERAAGSATAAQAEGGHLSGGGGGAQAESLPLTAECVGELAEMNHRLLCALGVGHPALERVCEVSSAHGCRSKLTGAGESVRVPRREGCAPETWGREGWGWEERKGIRVCFGLIQCSLHIKRTRPSAALAGDLLLRRIPKTDGELRKETLVLYAEIKNIFGPGPGVSPCRYID